MDKEWSMKKLLFSALLAGSILLPFNGALAADPADYIMCGGDQLQLTVYNHPVIYAIYGT